MGKHIIIDSKREVFLFENLGSLIDSLSSFFFSKGLEAIKKRGVFTVSLSGGSSPRHLYEALAKNSEFPWDKVLFFFGDERAVPPEDDRSNYKMAMETMLLPLSIAERQIFRMEAEEVTSAAAKRYADLLKTHLQDRPLDWMLLGLGEDAHTASLFPHTKALDATESTVLINEVPKLSEKRMTLTVPMINRSETIVFLVAGEAKKQALEKTLFHPKNERLYPAQSIGTEKTKALFYMDEKAAPPSLFQ